MKGTDKIVFDHPQLPFEEWADEMQPVVKPAEATDPKPLEEMEIIPDEVRAVSERLYYISFGSGSSGNSCYIGTDAGGIIVDAGVRPDLVEETLKRNGVKMSMVKALLLTHDHSDHVRYAYKLLRTNRHMIVCCTPRVLNGMLRRHNISRRIRDYHKPIFKEIPFKVGRMEITAFEVPHDGSDNMGFSISFGDHRFVLATDLGEITERADYYMSRANYLVIEANYDSDMLRLGRYPEYLKARIRAGNGHMDNEQTAAFLQRVVNPDMRYVFLCHLSQDNNTPAKALKAVRDALEAKGKRVGNGNETIEDRRADIQVSALPRFDASRWYVFR